MRHGHPPHVPQPRRHPVERFLGPEEAAGGPFALLGISPSACTDELILSALDRQIERIAHHPQCDTPEADEVRLALHASAAQLLDPAVRRHLIARWTGSASDPSAAPPEDPPPLKGARVLEHDAVLALGLYGGWNQQSLRRLLSIAHARGFTNAQVAETLRALAASRQTRSFERAGEPPQQRLPAPAQQPRHVSTPAHQERDMEDLALLDEQRDPLPRTLGRVGTMASIGLLAAAAAAALVYWIVTLTSPAPVPVAAAEEPEPVEVTTEQPAAEPQVAQLEERDDRTRRIRASDLPQEIAASVEALEFDPGAAAAQFAAAVEVLAARWTELPQDHLIATHDGIVEFLYRAGTQHDAVTQGLSAVAAPAASLADGEVLASRDVLPAVWSAGILARLMRESDLPHSARVQIESALVSAFGPAAPALDRAWSAGARAALLRVPHRLAPRLSGNDQGPEAHGGGDAQAWTDWATAVEVFAAGDLALRNRLLLVGLETLLIAGPEPNESRVTAEIIGDLVVRISWRDGDESRRWLLRAFGDRLISNADLHAVTSALATRSAAEGVDVTMVLSTSAAARVRADLRERYATMWNVGDLISREETTLAWIDAAFELLDEPLPTESEAELLGHAAILARLNEAAHWQWRGRADEAALIVADLRGPIEDALREAAHLSSDTSIYRSAEWAQRYLAVRQSIRDRRDLLEELSQMSGILGDVDAAVLVQEAVFGSPPEIRLQAIETVNRFAHSPAISKALLDRLPRMARIASNAEMVERVSGTTLPPVRDQSWLIEARRALVERLLETVSSEGPMARLDQVAGVLALSYHEMGTAAGGSPRDAESDLAAHAHRSARQVWSMWRIAAEPLLPAVAPPHTLSQIERRRTGRLAQAQGPVQTFAAEQVSIAELMAYVVTAERPGRAEEIHGIMDELGASRRSAQHIFEQMIAVEAAMLRLWLIRMEEDPT